jgi:hypothetical protein
MQLAQLLVRLFPLIIVGLGIVKGTSLFKDLVGGSFKTNTRQEVEMIARLIRADVFSGERAPTPSMFKAYLERSITQEKKNKKGVAYDYWGTLYTLQLQGLTELRIVSAGPDKVFGNTDDIMTKVSNVPDDMMPVEPPPIDPSTISTE